ncbi:hypothetical protein RhiLY_10862 [Ceratobasidium sp. AG-Ba]|nr:hypothetical protein RhiLY_10862 [Ceratobasidium sp. AG-Ba]
MASELPPILSATLRKRVFTDSSVFRLPVDQLDQIENTDNDRLSFLGRAAIDYVLASASAPVPDIDAQLSSLARSYEIAKFVNTSWLERDPDPRATEAKMMEAYVGALMLENEDGGMKFAQTLVTAMGGHISLDPPAQPRAETNSAQTTGIEATGQLHDLAARHGITLVWTDRPDGLKHAQHWTSDLGLQDKKTNQTWSSIARGTGPSKKRARADAAAKVLLLWHELMTSAG